VNDKLKLIFLGIVGFLVASVPVFAHHGNAQYESKVLTLKGTVTAWLWTNPHVFLKVDVKGWQRCSCGRSQGQRREVTNRVRWPDNAASETAAKAKI